MLRPCLVREDLSSHTPKTILLPRLSPNKGFVISFCSILSSCLLRHLFLQYPVFFSTASPLSHVLLL